MTQPGTNRQIADNAILDHFSKQTYLGNSYKYVLNFTSGATGEVSELLLVNPKVSTSAFPANYTSLFVDLRELTGLTTGNTCVIRSYINPTVSSAGTAQTPTNMRPASPNLSIATLTSAPSTSANGTLVDLLSVAPLTTISSQELIILDPGQSLLLTVQTSGSGTSCAVGLGWNEI